MPPYENYTQEIADWTTARGMVLINLTKKEETDPDGLSGFLLLMHLGATPERTIDRLHDYLGPLMDEIGRRGYRFVRVDELLGVTP